MFTKPIQYLATAACLTCTQVATAAQVSATPTQPVHGQSVSVELRDTRWQSYLPATRYVRVGSTIVIDYEYAAQDVTPLRADFGRAVVPLGELPPGMYNIEARLFQMDMPGSPPQVFSQALAIAPPEQWGIYLTPREPDAFALTDVLISSAAYFEPGSMRATVNGNVIRVDFDYRGDAPVGGVIPPGTVAFAALRLPSLGPGNYVIEGWGREKSSAVTQRYFTRPFTVSPTVAVREYYAQALDHYLMPASPADVALLESGSTGGWKRTGQSFKAWLRMGDGPPEATPICRFNGPSSIFYTGLASECAYLKALEIDQRIESANAGTAFDGWVYDKVAFYALLPGADGKCPRGSQPVFRSYNDRGAENDSNHRYTTDPVQRAAMAMSWNDEGTAFCSPE